MCSSFGCTFEGVVIFLISTSSTSLFLLLSPNRLLSFFRFLLSLLRPRLLLRLLLRLHLFVLLFFLLFFSGA